MVGGKGGVEGDAEQPALGVGVHGQIQRRRDDGAIDHPFHPPGGLLDDEEIVRAQEGEAGGLRQAGHHRGHPQGRVGERRLRAGHRRQSSTPADSAASRERDAGRSGTCGMVPRSIQGMARAGAARTTKGGAHFMWTPPFNC